MPAVLPIFRRFFSMWRARPGGGVLTAAFFLAAFLAGGPAVARQAGPDSDTENSTASPESVALRQALYSAVNKARAAAGARRVDRDAGFEAISGGHARDMVAKEYMSHVSPDGAGPRDRMLARFPDFSGVAGENIAQRSLRPGESAEDTALAAVEAWLDSPPHRKNLLSQRFGFAGIATADNGKALYIVMLLASEPSLRPPEPAAEPEDEPDTALPDPENPAENSVSDRPGT